MLMVTVFMATDRLEALAQFFIILLFGCLLTIFNVLLLAWPYAYVLKQCAEAEKRGPYEWYLPGLLLLEAILAKVGFYQNMPWLLVLFIFIYLVAFTWIYFNDTFKERDKKLSRSENN